MTIRADACLIAICILATPAAAQTPARAITLTCQGPKIESLRFPFSGRVVGSTDTAATFEVVLDTAAETAWINGKPARKAVFSDTEVALSARRGGALIRIDRFTGVWSAAGGSGICTLASVPERAF